MRGNTPIYIPDFTSKQQEDNVADLAVIESEYAALANPIEDTIEALRANMGNSGITQFDLSRVKVPTGGSTSWEIPDIEGSTASKTLDGVIVGWRDVRAYWADSFGGGTNPPDCSSPDAVTGVGNPGGDCASCEFAQFGSKGAGQACKLMRLLFVLRKADLLPLVLAAPPTSLAPIRKYFLQLASRSLPYWAVDTRFTLEKTKSTDGIDYSRIAPSLGARLTPEEVAQAKRYSDFFTRQQVNVGDFSAE